MSRSFECLKLEASFDNCRPGCGSRSGEVGEALKVSYAGQVSSVRSVSKEGCQLLILNRRTVFE